eukprot:Sspe_Gene.117382::Locus_108516_Transcript_1_1_Confidence_1.000_Length_1023::g.117382::m.117382
MLATRNDSPGASWMKMCLFWPTCKLNRARRRFNDRLATLEDAVRALRKELPEDDMQKKAYGMEKYGYAMSLANATEQLMEIFTVHASTKMLAVKGDDDELAAELDEVTEFMKRMEYRVVKVLLFDSSDWGHYWRHARCWAQRTWDSFWENVKWTGPASILAIFGMVCHPAFTILGLAAVLALSFLSSTLCHGEERYRALQELLRECRRNPLTRKHLGKLVEEFDGAFVDHLRDTDVCAVCLEERKVGSCCPPDEDICNECIVVVCENKHFLHMKCALEWNTKNSTCPVCRTAICPPAPPEAEVLPEAPPEDIP